MFRGKKESCRKQQEAGGRKTGLFEEELAKRMEKSGRNKGRYAARCHLTAFDGEKPSLSVILFSLQ